MLRLHLYPFQVEKLLFGNNSCQGKHIKQIFRIISKTGTVFRMTPFWLMVFVQVFYELMFCHSEHIISYGDILVHFFFGKHCMFTSSLQKCLFKFG